MKRDIAAAFKAVLEQMYVFTVLAVLLAFLVRYLTHEAANETMIAVLNTAIGGVTGMLGMAVASIFNTSKQISSATRARDSTTNGSVIGGPTGDAPIPAKT